MFPVSYLLKAWVISKLHCQTCCHWQQTVKFSKQKAQNDVNEHEHLNLRLL